MPEPQPQPIADGGPPTLGTGMSLRDWFAGQALAGLSLDAAHVDDAAFHAFLLADAMLERRSEEP